MKKIVLVILALLILTIAGFFLWQWWTSNNSNTPAQTSGGSESASVLEEYNNTVNANITLEQLQKSKVVHIEKILNVGSPLEQVMISIQQAEVTDIEGRTLTLLNNGETLKIFVGNNTEITLVKGKTRNDMYAGKFDDLKKGDIVNLGAVLLKDNPLVVTSLSIKR